MITEFKGDRVGRAWRQRKVMRDQKEEQWTSEWRMQCGWRQSEALDGGWGAGRGGGFIEWNVASLWSPLLGRLNRTAYRTQEWSHGTRVSWTTPLGREGTSTNYCGTVEREMTGGEKDKQNDARDEGLNWRESTGGIVCHVGQRTVLLCIVVLY